MMIVLGVMTVVVLLAAGFFTGMFFEWKIINKYCVLFGKNRSKK